MIRKGAILRTHEKLETSLRTGTVFHVSFLFAENYISRELLSLLKRVNGNKFERMDNMNNYMYDAVEAGKRIREVRKKNKYTQEQLAEKLFLTAESVSNFENGKTMCMPENVAKICEIFGVTADYIYYGIESAYPMVGILHHEEGVDLVPANLELSAMEFNLVNAMSRETTLKNYLSQRLCK